MWSVTSGLKSEGIRHVKWKGEKNLLPLKMVTTFKKNVCVMEGSQGLISKGLCRVLQEHAITLVPGNAIKHSEDILNHSKIMRKVM